MILYHATAERNLADIRKQGIKGNYDGVYLADSAKLATSFIFLRVKPVSLCSKLMSQII